jgi:hypothetical protein
MKMTTHFHPMLKSKVSTFSTAAKHSPKLYCYYFSYYVPFRNMYISASLEPQLKVVNSSIPIVITVWTAKNSRFDSHMWGELLLFSMRSRPALGPTHFPTQWVLMALSPELKWLGHEDDHMPPSTAKVKNA